ncbi:MAG: cytochrome c maturation protein CcmE [Burkholderiaceae bacterium]
MMNKTRMVRLAWIAGILAAVALTTYGVLRAFNDNMVFFYTPTQLVTGDVPSGRSYRIGGMVEPGSIVRTDGSLAMRFRVTDNNNIVTVSYTGIVPDLFKEGKGVVAQGTMQDGIFVSNEILAKHDENYMPPDLKK